MLKLFRLSCVSASLVSVALLSTFSSAHGQTTALGRQLDRVDFGVSGSAVFTKSVAGNNYLNQPVSLDASSTLGALVQIRYTKSPLLGAEFNYSYARFTERFSGSPFGGSNSGIVPFGVQANVSEYTVGYVAHLPTLLGFRPFAGGGAGATAFTPTKLGGQQGVYERARATYYYDVGVEDQFSKYFGVRAQFRQLFYKAPAFGVNYLTIDQRTFTTEPSVGFYVKF